MWNFPDKADREVTSVSVSPEGYVSRVWNDEHLWPSQSSAEVVLDLELGERAYYIRRGGSVISISDATDAGGRYLTCTAPGRKGNALLLLPRHQDAAQAELMIDEQLA